MRRAAITKKVSLEQFADGWDDCYAVVSLATYQEYVDFTKIDLKKLTAIELLGEEIKIVQDHFVSGKILLLQDDGTSSLEDMTVDDVTASPKIPDYLFSIIMGISQDPKDTSETSTALNTSSTETPTSVPAQS